MNEVINIQIAGQIFYIDKSAYQSLKMYLETIFSSLEPHEDKDEIMKDIEIRIAELFLARLKDSKQNLNQEDIDAIKKVMGDFENDQTNQREQSDQKSQASMSKAKLYRIPEEGFIAGVCAGLSKRYNLHVALIRLFFILMIFAMGVGLILYFIFWVILKTPGSVYQRLESRGDIPSFENIVKEFQNNETKESNPQTLQKIVYFPFFIIGYVIKYLVKFLTKNNRIKNINRFFLTMVCIVVTSLAGVLIYEFNQHQWMLSIIQKMITIIFLMSLLYLVILSLFKIYDFSGTDHNLPKHLKKSFKLIIGVNFLLIVFITSYLNYYINDHHEIETIQEITTDAKHLIIDIEDIDSETSDPLIPYFRIITSESDLERPKVEIYKNAYGKNYGDAEDVCSRIAYDVIIKDSIITLPGTFSFGNYDYFRNQSVNVVITIPKGYFITVNDFPPITYNPTLSTSKYYINGDGKSQVEKLTFYIAEKRFYQVDSKYETQLNYYETRDFVLNTMKILFSSNYYSPNEFKNMPNAFDRKIRESALGANLLTDLIYILDQSNTDNRTISIKNIESFYVKLKDYKYDQLKIRDYISYLESVLNAKKKISTYLAGS